MHVDCLPADGGWWGHSQVLHLKHHVNERREFDALAVGQTQHLIVIQYGVHVLDPQRIHRTIAHHPLMVLRGVLQKQKEDTAIVRN